MHRKNNPKRFLSVVAAVIVVCIYLGYRYEAIRENEARAYEYITVDHDTTWTKDDTLVFDRDVVIENNATLTLEKGTKIEFVSGHSAAIFVSDGRIVANGTEKEKVKITASDPDSGSFIQFRSPPGAEASFLRYVEISNLGNFSDGGPVAMKDIFVHTARAWEIEGIPALYFFSGKLHIENSFFIGNSYADIGVELDLKDENQGDFLEIVNSNFEDNDDNTAVMSKVYCGISAECRRRVLLKNNWYGDPGGPSGEIPNDDTQGEIVKGDVFLDGWKSSEVIADPVVIVPGITGSEKVWGKWKLDPILHTYDNLAQSFQENGYEKDKNLFEFPYDWHKSNEITSADLAEKIKEIISQTKVSRVDIAAHSMGGLVARAHVEGNEYKDNIDQLVTLGTPHKGVPEAYLKWEAGEGFFGLQEGLAKHHFKNEAKHNGYGDIYTYIRNEVPSVKELLPDYSYLFDVSLEEMRNYPRNYPTNNFLEELNEEENIQKLNKVNFINITGNISNEQTTISKIRVVDSTKSGLWEHGMPENFYDDETDQGLEYEEGDETVPKSSSQAISPNTSIEINSVHKDLPTKSQCKILYELANIEEEDCYYVDEWHIPNILLFNVFSPIDIQIIAPGGKRVGKNFATGELLNEIPGAYYTGYDTDTEFITIPNPEDGEYKVLTRGTGEGEYAIEIAKISQDETDPEGATEIGGMLRGSVTMGQEQERIIKVEEDEIITEEKDNVPPVVEIFSPEEKEYLNDQSVKIQYQTKDDVTIPEHIKIKLYLDGNVFNQEEIDLSLQKTGTHTLKITAIDEAGNESWKEVSFTAVSSLDSIARNIRQYYQLGLIKSKSDKKVLESYARVARHFLEHMEKIRNNPRIPESTREEIEERMNVSYKRYINTLIVQLKNPNQFKKTDARAKELLIDSLEYIVSL